MFLKPRGAEGGKCMTMMVDLMRRMLAAAALVFVAAAMLPAAAAQTQPVHNTLEDRDHDRTYTDKGDDGYIIQERRYILVGNGRAAGGMVGAYATDQHHFEAGNRKTIEFTVQDSEPAQFEVIVSYDKWESVFIPFGPQSCVKGSDVDLRVRDSSGQVVESDSEILNDCDGGTISVQTPVGIQNGTYTAEIYSEHGANLVLNQMNIEVFYK